MLHPWLTLYSVVRKAWRYRHAGCVEQKSDRLWTALFCQKVRRLVILEGFCYRHVLTRQSAELSLINGQDGVEQYMA
jgi:hypothetical protein